MAPLGAFALGACGDAVQGPHSGGGAAGRSSSNAGSGNHPASAGMSGSAGGAQSSDAGEAGESAADGGKPSTGGTSAGGAAAGGAAAGTSAAAGAGTGGTSGGGTSGGGTSGGGTSGGGTSGGGTSGGGTSGGGTSGGGASGGGAPSGGAAGTSGAGTANGGAAGVAASSSGDGGTSATAGTGGNAGGCNGVHGCPEPIVVGPSSKAWGVALDQSFVYWTTLEEAGMVLRAPLEGGLVETIASDEPRPFDIAVANGTAFWCAAGSDDIVARVMKAPAAGGTKEVLATSAGGNGVGRVIADGTQVYYLTNYNMLMSVPSTGGTPSSLSLGPFRSNITDLALSAGQLYWANSGIWDATYTLHEPGTAGIAHVGITGSPKASSLITQLDYPQFAIAVDDAHVYWNDEEAIYRTGLLGGSYSPVASLTAPPVSAVPPNIHTSPIVDLVSDGSQLYFADDRNVYRVAVSGGTPQLVSWGWSSIKQLALSENAVYFTDGVAGVVKLAK